MYGKLLSAKYNHNPDHFRYPRGLPRGTSIIKSRVVINPAAFLLSFILNLFGI